MEIDFEVKFFFSIDPQIKDGKYHILNIKHAFIFMPQPLWVGGILQTFPCQSVRPMSVCTSKFVSSVTKTQIHVLPACKIMHFCTMVHIHYRST